MRNVVSRIKGGTNWEFFFKVLKKLKCRNLLEARGNFVKRCSMICTLHQILLVFGNLIKEDGTGGLPGS